MRVLLPEVSVVLCLPNCVLLHHGERVLLQLMFFGQCGRVLGCRVDHPTSARRTVEENFQTEGAQHLTRSFSM